MRTAGPESSTGAQRRSSWLALVLLVLSTAWLALCFLHARGYWNDGAFVHLEFARSVSRGQGFRFNGHRVYADSSPVWVWLLAGIHVVIPSWIAAGKMLCVLTTVFALSGVFQLARSATRDLGAAQSRTFAAAMVLLTAVNPIFVRWAFSGMEAVGAAGLACWGLVAVYGSLREAITPRRLLLGCVCAGLAPLLRAEMMVFTLLLGFVLFVRWVNLPVAPRAKLLLFFSGFLLVGAPAIAWSLYALHVFGTVVPNTLAASVGGPNESTAGELLRTYGVDLPVVLAGVLVLGGWLVFGRRAGSSVPRDDVSLMLGATGWLPFVWAAATCGFLLAHHAHIETRYVLVSAPAMTVVLLALARTFWPRLYLGASAAGVLIGLATSLIAVWPLVTTEVEADVVYEQLAGFVHSLPANEPVAAKRVAEIAFLSEHPVVDMSGLTRPGVLPFVWDAMDNRRVWWAHEQGARYLVLDHAPEPKSTGVWSRDLPGADRSHSRREQGAFDRLILWKLPPSPTLPISAAVPLGD